MTSKWIGAHTNNFEKGRSGKQVNKVILHWIVGTLESADATFAKSDRIASAHYGIGDTDIHQYVQESDTAYHAGNLTVNRESIGIEHEGGPNLPVSEATIQTSIQLVADLCKRYSIPADKDHIKRHSDIKATQCPGTLPVERIISEAAKLLNPPDSLVWLKGMFAEIGIDLSKTEGEIRGRVQEVIDGYKKYLDLLKRVVKLESDLGEARGQAAANEEKVLMNLKTIDRLTGEIEDYRKAVANRDQEIESLKKQLVDAGASVIPQPQPNWLSKLLELIFKGR